MNAMIRLALLLGLAVSCVNAACPSNFVASVTIPGKCYYLSTANNTFFSAISYCRNLTYGADILSIANGFENSEVASLLQPRGISRGALIGNAFYDNKSHWIATAAGNSSYSNWGSGTHNGYSAVISSNGGWSPAGGYDAYPIICQIYPDDPTTFPPPQITCPAGWAPSISVRGKCYQGTPSFDFFSATRKCLTTRIGDSRAELVTLTSQLEMMELYATQPGAPWASLTSWEEDGNWAWIETLHPTNYFGPYGQPANSQDYGGSCAYSDYRDLYGTPCWSSEEAAICQYFPNEPPAPTLPGLNCPQNGIASITKPGTCYYVLGQDMSFQSAQSACQALDTGFTHNDLFVPRTVAEFKEFEAIMFNQTGYWSAWFGLTSSNGNWGWIPGRSSNISDIWCPGQPGGPGNPNDRCGLVVSETRDDSRPCWMPGDCRDSYAAICQSTNAL